MDELYDLEVDPFEMNNLVHDLDYAELEADMRARIISHLESITESDTKMQQMFLLALQIEQ